MRNKRNILLLLSLAVVLAAGWYFLSGGGSRGVSRLKPVSDYRYIPDSSLRPEANLKALEQRLSDLSRSLSSSHSALHIPHSELSGSQSVSLGPYLETFIDLADGVQVQGLFVQSYLRQVSERSAKEWDKKIAARARAEERLFAKRSDKLASKLAGIEKDLSRLLISRSAPGLSRAESRDAQRLAIKSLPFGIRFRLSRLARYLDSFSEPSPVLGVLSYHSPNYGEMEFTAGEAIVPAYLGGPEKGVVPGDTEGVLGAEISQEIIDKAEELGKAPIPLYEYVKNNFSYEPYFGSMKGALETLRQGAGNDADLSSLLIALFRASDWPARYVHGQAELNFCKAANWLGLKIPAPTTIDNFKDERRCDEMKDLVFQALSRAGIPFKPVVQGGKVVRVQVERVWVEAYVPYGNYRGAVLDNVGKSWIPLDPAMLGLDRYAVEPGPLDVLAGMGETGEMITGAYLEAATGPTPLEFYRGRVSNYLTTEQPDVSYQDILAKRTLVPEPLGLLPNTLTFDVPKVIHEYAVLPEEIRHRARLTFLNNTGEKIAEYLLDLPEAAGKRLTISYAGATPEDEAVIAANGGLMTTPLYLVKVAPSLRLNGVILSPQEAGEGSQGAIGLGLSHKLKVEIISPRGSEYFSYSLLAGNYYGLGLGSGRTSFKDPDEFIQCPTGDQDACSQFAVQGVGEGLVPSQIDDASDADGMGGRLLYQRVADYMNGLFQGEEEIAASLNLRLIRPASSLALIGNELEVISSLGIPQSLEWKGVKIDARSRPIYPVVLSASEGSQGDRAKDFMQLSGFHSSSLENKVFELGFGVEAISAVKTIQLAHAQGMEVVDITGDNIGQVDDLGVSDEVKEDIKNRINQGLRITVPRDLVSYQDWIGTGYIALDPQTKEASYLLQGNILGGMTVADPRSNAWPKDIKDILENPNPPKPADPKDAKSIRKVPATDWQYGKVWEVMEPLQVLVTNSSDEGGRPVRWAKVVFEWIPKGAQGNPARIKGGEDKLLLSSDKGKTWEYSVAVSTNALGIAQVWFRPYKYVDHYWAWMGGDPNDFRVGLNEVTATLITKDINRVIKDPFYLIGKAGDPKVMDDGYGRTGIITAYDGAIQGVQFPGAFRARVLDEYGNPVANQAVDWSVATGEGKIIDRDLLAGDYRLTQYLKADPSQVDSIVVKTDENGMAPVEAIAGMKPDQSFKAELAKYSLALEYRITGVKDPNNSLPNRVFGVYFNQGNVYGLAGQSLYYPSVLTCLEYDKDSQSWASCTSLAGTLEVDAYHPPKYYPPDYPNEQITSPVVMPYSGGATAVVYPRLLGLSDNKKEKDQVVWFRVPDGEWIYEGDTYYFVSAGEVKVSAYRETPTHTVLAVANGGTAFSCDHRIGFSVYNPAGFPVFGKLVQETSAGVTGAQIVYSSPEMYEFSPQATNTIWFPFVSGTNSGKLRLEVYHRGHYLESGKWKERYAGIGKYEVVVTPDPINMYVLTKDPELPTDLNNLNYYPALGEKTIEVVAEEKNGPVPDREMTFELLNHQSDVEITPAKVPLVNGVGKFKLKLKNDNVDLVPGTDPSIRIKFKLVPVAGKENAEVTESFPIKNNSNVSLKEVLEGKAVWVYDKKIGGEHPEAHQGKSAGRTVDQLRFDFAQELFNQVMPRKRSITKYALIPEDGYFFGDAMTSALYVFKRGFNLGINTSISFSTNQGVVTYDKADDTSNIFRKLMKDYGKRGVPKDSEPWLEWIVDKDTLVKNGFNVTDNWLNVVNASGEIIGDAGLYELYVNVVKKFVDGMIAEAERYVNATGFQNVEGNWKPRTYPEDPAQTIGVSYCYGCRDKVEDFSVKVTRCSGPTPMMFIDCFTYYQGEVNDDQCGDLANGECRFDGVKKYPGLYKGEFDTKEVYPQYEPTFWTGIDCSGLVANSMKKSNENVLVSLAPVWCGNGLVTWSNSLAADCWAAGTFFRETVQTDKGEKLMVKMIKPDTDKKLLKRGDLVAYARRNSPNIIHNSIIYCSYGGEIHDSMPANLKEQCQKLTADQYMIVHASGNNCLDIDGSGTCDQGEPFNRKVVINSTQYFSKTPIGFGRVKLWD